MSGRMVLRPQPGPQTDFLQTCADIAVYGGGAGGGKTWDLVFEPVRHIGNPDFAGVVFRRTSPQITNPGGLWDASSKIYPHLKAEPRISDRSWHFPSGSLIRFGHLQHETTVYNWQGSELPFIGWDELTHFSESQFFYMLSRNRSMCGVRPYMRGTTNPDADSWLASFMDWWIGEDGYPIPERAGKIRYFVRVSGQVKWADSPEELKEAHGRDLIPKSFTFIPANVYDNRALMEADPGYVANLMAQTEVEKERLLLGNWKIRAEAGKVFNRDWFPIIPIAPKHGVIVRFFDFAASEKKTAGDDPDFSATVKMMLGTDGKFYVLHAHQERIPPAEIDERIAEYAQGDYEEATRFGNQYMIRWETEPGSAGLRETWRLVQMLRRYDAEGIRPEGDKITRALPGAKQAKVGNVRVVEAPWNDELLQHLHHQPDWPHDDLMDAFSGAYNSLAWMGAEEELANAFGWS